MRPWMTALASAALLFSIQGISAQTVDEAELKSADLNTIQFQSYVGPHRVIETRQAIKGIGTALGQDLLADQTKPADVGGKYRVFRVHDAASPLLSADVLELEKSATVDNIRNLNWIVAAYLKAAFAYSDADAELVADFVTRYNALYRGKMDYLRSHYALAVIKAVDPAKVGIALQYSQWPGMTQLLIPVRDSLSKGLSGSVNAEEISNPAVTQSMTAEPDQGVGERKKLADLKEAEIVQEKKAIVQAETAPAQPAAAPAPSPVLPAQQNSAAVPSAPKAAAEPKTSVTAPPPAAKAQPAIPLEKAKAQVEARDKALTAERQDIVKTEKKQEATPPPPAPAIPPTPAGLQPFIHWNDASNLGQLWLVDPAGKKVWKKSDLNSIRQPLLISLGSNWLVVAGTTKSANGAVRLAVLSGTDAATMATGTDEVSPELLPVTASDGILALISNAKGEWTLAKFDSNLRKTAQGTDSLSPHSSVVATAKAIYVQSLSGAVLELNPQTLAVQAKTEG